MIPKVIHFCWLSNDPYPKEIANYMKTWEKVLPDYEIRKWDFNRFPKDKSIWVKEAFESRKYAFAADYIRNYALYTEGGIYLDSDVEVFKKFDILLKQRYFFGFENGTGCIEAAVMGSEPGNPVFGMMLDYYDGRHFINPDGSLNTLPLPKLMNQILKPHYTIREINDIEDFTDEPGTLSVLPYDFFSPIHNESRRLMDTSRTIAIHRLAASWQPPLMRLKRAFRLFVGPDILEWLLKTKRSIFGQKKATNTQK